MELFRITFSLLEIPIFFLTSFDDNIIFFNLSTISSESYGSKRKPLMPSSTIFGFSQILLQTTGIVTTQHPYRKLLVNKA